MSSKRNIVVVGGSSGIGLALTGRLVNSGHAVYSASRRPFGNENSIHLVFDALKDDLPVESLPEKLDGFVYCPGSINLKPFHRLTDQDFLDDFQLNCLGAARCLRAALPLLKNAEHASVIFFSTVAVSQGMPFHSSIAAAKGAVEGLAKSLAAELAPKIRVNVIAPSLTNTPLASKILSSDEKQKASADRHPLKRVGTADDIASLAAFLLSDESSWITGQVMHVDGGLTTVRS
jgi:NAD(P)-dependent dehydrogenase (short-subunit alcohol dehydrogenase family)